MVRATAHKTKYVLIFLQQLCVYHSLHSALVPVMVYMLSVSLLGKYASHIFGDRMVEWINKYQEQRSGLGGDLDQKLHTGPDLAALLHVSHASLSSVATRGARHAARGRHAARAARAARSTRRAARGMRCTRHAARSTRHAARGTWRARHPARSTQRAARVLRCEAQVPLTVGSMWQAYDDVMGTNDCKLRETINQGMLNGAAALLKKFDEVIGTDVVTYDPRNCFWHTGDPNPPTPTLTLALTLTQVTLAT
jgi:hypothetical protein